MELRQASSTAAPPRLAPGDSAGRAKKVNKRVPSLLGPGKLAPRHAGLACEPTRRAGLRTQLGNGERRRMPDR